MRLLVGSSVSQCRARDTIGTKASLVTIKYVKCCSKLLDVIVRHVLVMLSIFSDGRWMASNRISLCDPKINIVVFKASQAFVEAINRQQAGASIENCGMHLDYVKTQQREMCVPTIGVKISWPSELPVSEIRR